MDKVCAVVGIKVLPVPSPTQTTACTSSMAAPIAHATKPFHPAHPRISAFHQTPLTQPRQQDRALQIQRKSPNMRTTPNSQPPRSPEHQPPPTKKTSGNTTPRAEAARNGRPISTETDNSVHIAIYHFQPQTFGGDAVRWKVRGTKTKHRYQCIHWYFHTRVHSTQRSTRQTV